MLSGFKCSREHIPNRQVPNSQVKTGNSIIKKSYQVINTIVIKHRNKCLNISFTPGDHGCQNCCYDDDYSTIAISLCFWFNLIYKWQYLVLLFTPIWLTKKKFPNHLPMYTVWYVTKTHLLYWRSLFYINNFTKQYSIHMLTIQIHIRVCA